MRAGIYTRVSTSGQSVDNQLHELRSYVDARGWTVTEYTDVISGGHRPKTCAGQDVEGCAAPQAGFGRVLALGSPRPQPQALGEATRRIADTRGELHQPQ